MTCCHAFSKSSKLLGTLFRDYTHEISVQVDDSINIRLAQQRDIPHLLTYDSDLYETVEELQYTVSGNMVYMFEKNEKLIGCGYLIKILLDKHYYDIVMWVNPDFRHCGYASMIISYLKNYCLSKNYIPVCGCASDNIASRKTLERNGFLSKYCLIEFTV